VSIYLNRDLPIEIRPQHRGANRCEAFQDLGRRVTEAIAAAATDHGDVRPPGVEQRR
jgi:hypothetical protein